MDTDTSGYLYAANQYGSVLRIDRTNLSSITFADFLTGGPQGVVFDEVNNRLIVCAYEPGSIMWSIDVATGVKTAFAVGTGHQDGITIDNDGNILTSAFWWEEVYGWDPDGNPLGLIASGLDEGPKGLYFNRRDSVLAVPLLFTDSVAFLSFADQDGDTVVDFRDNCPSGYNPNQDDLDSDGVGDSCDLCPSYDDLADGDGDKIADSCDNCPAVANADQTDIDFDGMGDSCDCCSGLTGNVDGDSNELVDIGDLTALIAYLYIPPNTSPDCLEAANVDGDSNGLVDIGDLTALISYLYIPPNPPPSNCG
jgi:hypothetical protein